MPVQDKIYGPACVPSWGSVWSQVDNFCPGHMRLDVEYASIALWENTQLDTLTDARGSSA